MFWKQRKTMVALALTVAVAGCGGASNTVPVQGVVTYDGQPVEGVIVKFTPKKGRPSEALTEQDGSFDMWYTMDEMGVERDSHEVSIYWAPETDDGTDKPSELEKKVLMDFRENGPLDVTIDEARPDFNIELPR